MAYTKIFAIRKRLDKTVRYAAEPTKTELEVMTQYAGNQDKHSLVTAINCSQEYAAQEMQDTKMRWGKADGVQGYHIIQSFVPGEVTPELAHEIGVQFVQRMFGSQYEVLIGTHLDQKHLHNHIVVNSVSLVDGKKYHSNPKGYYEQIRRESDELCRTYHLSVIVPEKKGKHYAEWQADQERKPTIRSMIRADIDCVIADSYNFQTFLMLLEQRGYVVKYSSKRKYTAVQPPGGKRAIRLDSLGNAYTEAAIQKRIKANRNGIERFPVRDETKSYYRMKNPKNRKPARKITGFQALYFRYVYLLKGYQKGKRRQYLSADLRKEVIRLERYQEQFRYLIQADISTEVQLKEKVKHLEETIQNLSAERKPLYQKRKLETEGKEYYTKQIERYTDTLRELRKELRLCKEIVYIVPVITKQVKPEGKPITSRKEELHDEYQWRNR